MTTKPFIDIILAMDENNAIGHDRQIPWEPLPTDFKWYITLGTTTKDPRKRLALIVGRATFEDLLGFEEKYLSRWHSIVITSQAQDIFHKNHPNIDRDHVDIVHSFEQAVEKSRLLINAPDSMIESAVSFGGSTVYEQAIASKLVKRIYLTRILAKVPNCNNIVANFDLTDFRRIKRTSDEILAEYDDEIIEENGWKYQFQIYENIRMSCE